MNVRKLAVDAIDKIMTNNAYSNIVVNDVLNKFELSDEDRGLFTNLVYGTLQHLLTIEYYISPFIAKKKPKHWVRYLLYMSVYQIVYLKTADYAVVNEATSIARVKDKQIASFVNGVLRNFLRTPLIDIEKLKDTDEVEYLSVKYSHPAWLVAFFLKDYSFEVVEEILKENTDFEKDTETILKHAQTLHEDLRNYGNLKDTDKPLVVSGILLALDEIENGNFSINNLTGDKFKTDGQKIYEAIESNLKRVRVAPDVKRDKILSQFSIIRDTTKINEINKTLAKTPLKHFTEFLYENIFKSIKYNNSAEDYIGRFYGEFMSYSGGDGQTLGIVLTPKHITQLFCDLVDLKSDDIVLDPCCGTGGFLISAMHNMIKQVKGNKQLVENIKEKQLHGVELQTYMFAIATTNMILRGDGKSNLINDDFLAQNPKKLQEMGFTVGFMNPPYSQGSKKNSDLYEIAFIEHLLNSLTKGARCVVIVPQSSMTGKTKDEQNIKDNILKHHTLEGVITLNKDTFYGVGTMTCIAVFTAGKPHPENKICKFINFQNDGFVVKPHIGLVETDNAKDKKQHLLDVWFDRAEDTTKFCVKTTIESADE